MQGLVLTTAAETFSVHNCVVSYYKSKLELKSNSSEIFPVICKFICASTPSSTDKTQTRGP